MEGSSGIRLSQTEKMQREADHYTKKYEWERRNLLTLQDVEFKLQGEIATLKKSVAQLKKESEEGEVKLMFTKMRNLQKHIDIVYFLLLRTTKGITKRWVKSTSSETTSTY
jgi:hypothetical protein